MTGVAAQKCGNPDKDFKNQIDVEMPSVKWGTRKAILSDLAVAATYISNNHNQGLILKNSKLKRTELWKRVRKNMDGSIKPPDQQM